MNRKSISRFQARARSVLLLYLANIISRFVPRSENIWVFGGGNGIRFADNSMHLFKYCVANSGKRCIWLTHDPELSARISAQGYEVHLINSPRGLYCAFRAAWHIFDVTRNDTGRFGSIGARTLNLWHGVPLKNINWLKPRRMTRAESFFHQLLWRSSPASRFMTFPNRRYVEHVTRSFDVMEENVILSNLPRNACLCGGGVQPDDDAQQVIDRLQALHRDGARLVGYFPTWRDAGNEPMVGNHTLSELIEINNLLRRYDSYLVVKRHPCSFKKFNHRGYNDSAERLHRSLGKLSNVIALDFETDLNPVLNICDALISDYSGAIVDFLLKDRPIILFVPDHKVYSVHPGLFFDLGELGQFCHLAETAEGLMALLETYLDDPGAFSNRLGAERRNMAEVFFETRDGFGAILRTLDASGSTHETGAKECRR